MPTTIDATPSWGNILKYMLAIIETSVNNDSIKEAKGNLVHMSQVADRYVALLNEDKTKVNAFHVVKIKDLHVDLALRLKHASNYNNALKGFFVEVDALPGIITSLLRFKDKTAAEQATTLYNKTKDLTFIHGIYE